MNQRTQNGFSLVELSIVLVILGLLVGGVLSGQSLIRASELRKYVTMQDRYRTAILSFRDKYFGLPGDTNNATRFWSAKSVANCTNNAAAPVVADTGTCDGNGDGTVSYLPGNDDEANRVWEHLSRAGLVEGSYSYVWGGNGEAIGPTLPSLGINSAGATLHNVIMHLERANYLHFGAVSGFSTGLVRGIMKPEEAWNIDTKLDDGKGGTGAVKSHYDGSDASAVAVRCVDNFNDPSANYQLQYSEPTCTLYFKL